MQEMIVKIESDGQLTFIYADGHLGLTLGKVEIKRASDVRYENGAWRIFLKKETVKEGTHFNDKNYPKEIIIGHPHKNRADAINEEVKILNTLLSLGEVA